MLVGLTESDLREIANVTEKINDVLINDDPGYEDLENGDPFRLIKSISIYRPDSGDKVGYLVDEGGWFGFYFSSE